MSCWEQLIPSKPLFHLCQGNRPHVLNFVHYYGPSANVNTTVPERVLVWGGEGESIYWWPVFQIKNQTHLMSTYQVIFGMPKWFWGAKTCLTPKSTAHVWISYRHSPRMRSSNGKHCLSIPQDEQDHNPGSHILHAYHCHRSLLASCCMSTLSRPSTPESYSSKVNIRGVVWGTWKWSLLLYSVSIM